MKILVTGIAGFIGTALIKVLCNTDYSIVGIDIKDYSAKSTNKIKYIKCDLSEDENLDLICQNIDVVIHLAGISNIGEPEELYKKNNTLASSRLIDAAIKNNVDKIIFLSSVKVNVLDDYGSSKYDIENIIKDKSKSNNLTYTIIRSTLVFGAGMKSNICQWILRIRNSFMPVLPANDSELAMIGIKDLSNCIQICIENNNTNNKTYTLSDNNNYKINDIESTARKHLHRKSFIIFPILFFTLSAKIGDLICLFGVQFPFNSRIMNILFNNEPVHEAAFQIDTGYEFQQNFLTEIPVIFPYDKDS